MTEHVLRIVRDDVADAFVLVNVTSNGPLPLDLTILATESEAPYVAKCQC